LVEAHSPTGEIYGSERLREVVRANSNGPPSALVRGVLDALETFARHGDPHDDVTMLAARLVSSDE
jgi:sigma-B regulation protein RsbU (phosphoserine phosphatase)